MYGRCKLTIVLTAAVLASSCKPAEEPSRIELTTIDVQPHIDAALTTAYDETAIVYGDTVSGVLPSDFPQDIPLYIPASLINMGTSETGRPFVVLATPHGSDLVNQAVVDRLAKAGWTAVSTDSSGLTTFGRGSRRVWLRVETSGVLTEITVEYVPDR